ncbi:MAG: NAD+ synthase, partial [Rhizobiaceae bacterium]|nr:NAD+ synthase [Rhizobiaceae bacterium]
MKPIKNTFRIAVAQMNPTVGDIAGNIAKAREARADAARQGADLLLLTELFLCGYPPEDLVLKPAFLASCMRAVETFAAETADGGPGVIIGFPRQGETGRHNAAAVLDDGRIVAICDKVDLPNYGEFDEKRVFVPGGTPKAVDYRGIRIGVPICEDIWNDAGVCEALAADGAEILLHPNGSPYYRGKIHVRHDVVLRQIDATGLPLVFANQLGGQDELVFDGASFAYNADKSLALQMSQFEEALVVTTWKRQEGGPWRCERGPHIPLPSIDEADYRACVLGFKDYVNKNGFKSVVLGLSGGIDSALCAAIAVDALGEERVRTVMMPYRYTSRESLVDAEACARALGTTYDIVAIEEPVTGFLSALSDLFEGTEEGITEENLQSRARGTILMAIS